MHRLAAMRGVGAGTPSSDLERANLEATLWYDEPELKTALKMALNSMDEVASFEVLEPLLGEVSSDHE